MCIRDRRVAGLAGATVLGNGDVALIINPIALAARTAEHGSCLLYTSDAADERSSVDLGGRRIIKKKRHELTCTCLCAPLQATRLIYIEQRTNDQELTSAYTTQE